MLNFHLYFFFSARRDDGEKRNVGGRLDERLRIFGGETIVAGFGGIDRPVDGAAMTLPLGEVRQCR